MYTAIVFLPLLGALIAGLFGRVIGHRPAEIITSSLLVIAAVNLVLFSAAGAGFFFLRKRKSQNEFDLTDEEMEEQRA